MIELTGSNLGQRQKQLNLKIKDTTKNAINFDEIKNVVEKTDVDKLYKIGVASEYKDVEYIIETLKSGDTLYISKALKCIWLYEDDYSHIINSEYLHEKVFPFMSFNMTRKFLSTISMYVKDGRAIDFYTYCKGKDLTNIAMKFLIFTPEAFRLESLNDKHVVKSLKKSKDVKHFLGNSVSLTEAYFNKISPNNYESALNQVKHFYSVSDVKYLEMVRKVKSNGNNLKRLGLRISKDIMKKHKDEIYKTTIPLLRLLNESILVRYSSIDDAKFYVKTLLSHDCLCPDDFWDNHFCDKYKLILDKIPLAERLHFIKSIFTDRYPKKDFETTLSFYRSKLYKLMTPDEREKWALNHIESGLEILGTGKDFLWYKFVSFDKAFPALKKYIRVAVDVGTRMEILLILPKSAKTDSELETLFDYYYKRHVNEKEHHKKDFLNTVLSKHNIYNISESCWGAFNKILYSLGVYKILDSYYDSLKEYKVIALIYFVIHKQEIPEALTRHIDEGLHFYKVKRETDKLSESNVNIVYNYLLEFYLNKIKLFEDQTYNEKVENEVKKYVHFVLDLMFQYEKPKENIPDIVNKYINLNIEEFENHLLLRVKVPELEQKLFISYLKKDKDIIISQLPEIKKFIKNDNSIISFVKIVRTYFKNDLATVLLELFQELLADKYTDQYSITTCVHGIFELADIDFRNDFMTKYVPTEAKIDHTNIDQRLLEIQKSICYMICYCRPPVPLSDVTQYIKGDYVHFCSAMFKSYLAKLPKPLCIEFVKSLLNAPLSIQKHGIRLAFKCFNVDDLRKLVLEVWRTTKNVSLRSVIYRAVCDKIINLYENEQNQLFEDLKTLTRSLHEEDDEEIFGLLTSWKIPRRFIAEHLEVVWEMVNKLPNKSSFISRRAVIINSLQSNIYLIKEEVINSIIYEHINVLLKQQEIKLGYESYDLENLSESKWNLLYTYVTYFTDDHNFLKKSEIIMDIMKICLKNWNKIENNKYFVREFVSEFIKKLNEISYNHDVSNYARVINIFEQILKELEVSLLVEEIYEMSWDIRVSNIARNVIIDGKKTLLGRHENRSDTIDKVTNVFVEKFVSLFIASIESKQCYPSFFHEIENIFVDNLRQILTSLNEEADYDPEINTKRVLVCLKMLEHETFETYMFSLELLPCDISYCSDRNKYLDVLNKIKSYEHGEIKFNVYKKFGSSCF